MPSLTLRSLGMSYVVEGLREAGLKGQQMYRDLAEVAGEGVAPLMLAKPSAATAAIDAVIVDRRAMTWEELREWVRLWVVADRGTTAEWDSPSSGGTQTLRFSE